MKINKIATAGTLESSDILITIEPAAVGGIRIELSSVVEKQFGEHIRQVIRETATKHGVRDALIIANDRGALDCTIVSRVTTALYRSAERIQTEWGVQR